MVPVLKAKWASSKAQPAGGAGGRARTMRGGRARGGRQSRPATGRGRPSGQGGQPKTDPRYANKARPETAVKAGAGAAKPAS